MEFDHIALNVKSIHTSVQWYRENTGATVEYEDFFEFLNHSETAKEMSNDRYMFFPNEQKCKEFCRNYHKIAKKYEDEQKRKATKH